MTLTFGNIDNCFYIRRTFEHFTLSKNRCHDKHLLLITINLVKPTDKLSVRRRRVQCSEKEMIDVKYWDNVREKSLLRHRVRTHG